MNALTSRGAVGGVEVSVIIATANRPALLRAALRSLAEQRDVRWEAIVVDDGDGQGAAAALDLGDDRIRARTNPGSGQVDARNTAIRHALGDAVCWLDDDDWLEDPHHLASAVQRLRRAPALLHRGGWMVHVDEDGRELRRDVFCIDTDARSLRRDNTILNPGVAYPRALHRWLGPLDRGYDGYYDWDWYLRVSGVGVPIERLPGLGGAYRIHHGNRSRTTSAARRRSFDALCAAHGLDVAMKHHVEVWHEHNGASQRTPAQVVG